MRAVPYVGDDANFIGGFEMIRKSVLLAITLAILTVPSFCVAQNQKPDVDSNTDVSNADRQPDRAAAISEAMDFGQKDAAAFWPIYQEYEHERSALYNHRMAVLKEYKEKYLSMSDEDAKAMANRMFEYDSQAMELNRKYFRKFNKVLPTYTVAKFFELEHRIDLMLEMKAAPSLPPLPQLDQGKGEN